MAFGDLNRINTNIQSLESRFSLDKINRSLGKTQLRLATGLKVNRAEDDAAGFSIGAKLSARIAGLEQALSNAGEAKSVLDMAEASLDTILTILSEMKMKATQAANDTYGTEERHFIQLQMNGLFEELDSLVRQTVYQGRTLLGNPDDPTSVFEATFQVGERVEDTIFVRVADNQGRGFTPESLQLADSNGDSLLGVETHASAQEAMQTIDRAIFGLAEATNTIGITQSRLSIREDILTQSIISNASARSRIMDADFAKEQSEAIKLQILQQTATAALTQANLSPQAVLGFIG